MNYLPTRPSLVSVLGSAVTVCTATSDSLILVCKSRRSSINSSLKTSDGCWTTAASDNGGSGCGEVFRILQRAAKRIFGSGWGLIPAVVHTLSTPALNVGHETEIKIIQIHNQYCNSDRYVRCIGILTVKVIQWVWRHNIWCLYWLIYFDILVFINWNNTKDIIFNPPI